MLKTICSLPLFCTIFFSGGKWLSGFFTWGTGGPPRWQKVCPPPHRPLSLLFDQSLSPFTEFCPRKFLHFYLLFLSILTTFQLKTASESSILCLKHQNLLKFCCRGIFGLRVQFFQVLPHLTPSPTQVPPPIWLRPQQGPKIVQKGNSPSPTKILWKKNPVKYDWKS